MEANPGSAEADKFAGFRAAGINRLSIGIQSFQSAQLQALGRVHNSDQAHAAIAAARAAGFERLNLDLMHGLPQQDSSLALGDLTATMDEPSPCGRTNMRIKGWMGRADQTTKIKGMFVRPEQIAAVLAQHPEVTKARLVVTREGETDAMALHCETARASDGLAEAIAATLQGATKLRGRVVFAPPGSLANDGKVIADERKYD
jgi:acyl-CoA synthetase (AMP-forming)/AMP-acid ligase II